MFFLWVAALSLVSTSINHQKIVYDNGLELHIAFAGLSGPVTASDLSIYNINQNQWVSPSEYNLTYDSNTQVAVVRFPAPPLKALPDGLYLASFFNREISLEFYSLPSDLNRDRKTDTQDFNVLSGNFNRVQSGYQPADFNKDGLVNGLDFNFLASKYGAKVPESN